MFQFARFVLFGAFPAVLLEISINHHHNHLPPLCIIDGIILTLFIRSQKAFVVNSQFFNSVLLPKKHFLIPATYSGSSSKWNAAMQLQEEISPLSFLVDSISSRLLELPRARVCVCAVTCGGGSVGGSQGAGARDKSADPGGRCREAAAGCGDKSHKMGNWIINHGLTSFILVSS